MANDDAIGNQITRIRQKLEEVIRARLRPFGCNRHGFRLGPCADADDLELFESLCEVALPAEYRRFISEMGDGGAGPAYGLLALGRGLAYERTPVTPDLLRQPFPFAERADASQVIEPRPGSISLCDEGGNARHFLVITGPTRGSMWIDRTSSGGGYEPLGVDFLTWYERWLDSTLAGGNGAWWHRHGRS
jgi:hypothetical protein